MDHLKNVVLQRNRDPLRLLDMIREGQARSGCVDEEVAIRAYDPCLSCATHAVGRMPLEIAAPRR